MVLSKLLLQKDCIIEYMIMQSVYFFRQKATATGITARIMSYSQKNGLTVDI